MQDFYLEKITAFEQLCLQHGHVLTFTEMYGDITEKETNQSVVHFACPGSSHQSFHERRYEAICKLQNLFHGMGYPWDDRNTVKTKQVQNQHKLKMFATKKNIRDHLMQFCCWIEQDQLQSMPCVQKVVIEDCCYHTFPFENLSLPYKSRFDSEAKALGYDEIDFLKEQLFPHYKSSYCRVAVIECHPRLRSGDIFGLSYRIHGFIGDNLKMVEPSVHVSYHSDLQ